MQLISQQPQPEDYYRILKDQAKTHERLNLNLMTIHQLDCIYYGEINKSYQKEGFGILQALSFEHYVGFWKNNKVEGLGLVIFPGGEVIYGEFSRNTLNGIGIVDDGKFLRLGVFEGVDLNGVGFEYTYPTSKWRMIKYSKGMPIEQLREEIHPLADGIPDMIAAQHTLCQFLSSYIKRQFFPYEEPKPKKGKSQVDDKYRRLNEVLISSKQDLVAIGLRDEGGMHGLGVIINIKEKIMHQSGFYTGNELNGYCLQGREGNVKYIGPFFNGLKHGTFIKGDQVLIEVVEFDEGIEAGAPSTSSDNILKRQKSYNFEQKDFLSAKNTLEFPYLYSVFTPPEARHNPSRSKYNYDETLTKQNKTKQFQRTPSYSGKRQILAKEKISHTYLEQAEKQGERSCVDIIRQKMRGYDMIKSEKSARLSSEEKRKRILDSNLNVFNDFEQSIAIEENPFDSVARGINLIHQSPQRRH